MKKVFITGGTGFFGRSFYRHYRPINNYEVTVLSREPQSILGVKWIRGDVRNFEFPLEEFDYILHGAATSSKIIPDEETKSVIMEGTKHILDFAKRQKNLKNFTFISSGAVYGIRHFPVKETEACTPVTVYGKAKLEAEQMCLDSIENCSIARCFAFIGEDLPLDTHFAIGNFIKDFLEKKDIVIKGDGTPLRSYMYSKDLAHWVWEILLNGRSIFNVGSDKLISIVSLAQLIQSLSKYYIDLPTPKIHVLGDPVYKGSPVCYVPNTTRAKSLLKLDMNVSLETAIRKTIDYHRRNERGDFYSNISI